MQKSTRKTGFERWRGIFVALISAPIATQFPSGFAQQPAPDSFDIVLSSGRVMDPESGLDAVRDVGIAGGKIVAISSEKLHGKRTIDARGLVVAPGFIAIHAHGQDLKSSKLQAQDGVTTALETELGTTSVGEWYAKRDGKALINFGVSAGHRQARILVKNKLDVSEAILEPDIRAGGTARGMEARRRDARGGRAIRRVPTSGD